MDNIYKIANKIKSNGGNLYLVGGAIRDQLLGIINHDEDYCVTGISFNEFKKLFPEANIIGKDFPVNCTNGHKVMKQYGITEGKEVASKMHELRVLYLKNKS